MHKITFGELLKKFAPVFQKKIEAAIERYPDATHVVIFENHNFDSSRFGERTAILVGPSNTYKSPEACEGKYLGDLPSERQYADNYAEIERQINA